MCLGLRRYPDGGRIFLFFSYKPANFSKLMDRQAVVVRIALVRHNRRSATTLCVLNAKDWQGQDKH